MEVHWNGLSCPPPGDLPNPGIEPMSLTSPALADGFSLPSTPLGKSICVFVCVCMCVCIPIGIQGH